MAKDNTWNIQLSNFFVGYAPLAFTNNLTEVGGAGAASAMTNVDVLTDRMTQGPALSTLTSGDQTGSVDELITYIMDRAVTDDVTYAIGATKFYTLSSTAVTNTHTISGCTDGESIQVIKGNAYYFYNKASGGEVGKFDLSSTYDDDWGSTVPFGGASIENAIHPSTSKEDTIVFGNGQYVGTYIVSTNTFAPRKLDFGEGTVCADVIYSSGYWYLAINSGITGTNRTTSQIYLWAGAALTTTLEDEAAVGVQRIGFLYVLNGTVFVAYQDLSSSGFIIGYINGKAISPLARFTGDLPTFAQKTLYKGTIAFLSSGLVYSAGAFVDTLPFQLSQHADGGHSTAGAIAAPFGTPMVSSTDGGSNSKIAKFSGYDTNCSWESIVFPLSTGKYKGYIDEIIVHTNILGADARCDLTIKANQAVTTSTTQQITGTGETRHYFDNFGLAEIEDFKVRLDWSNGNATNPVAIRSITINGHFTEST